ncbi:LysE/ArgO family amino acid transporter [Pasteurella skyensis]|uniref:LysE/ArgO family amino acid transporter n=1 Tax=Phocoenobacter skyensis TaxID=97481 RepID=A0AAJ6NA71_9PAST|nr:LysE/ArgO family amino acid transporter [Pasteurella skyensis]MDP8163143.1 LysE/ArgO family amino acid transporter [Pasteurella skyensis]MDP8173036.1 LysE/ArgO family amino acid transporter [Pasteurella skyensis]MDP8177134.1 LysE/ArgO family amino acid transporter [Pasteurella skyensis]MDP8179598.1 LysE/ArgO family amino acid transporter [Pasteurella skyensis]MDP8183787.1 LysE/ArgO family amino acid transporter [Pasteurella skyensis]
MFDIFVTGFLTSATLIIAIGAQNAFVLKRAISNSHIFITISVCFLCDFVLMSMGVLGLGQLIVDNTIAKLGLSLLGATFLLFYGISSLKSAFQDNVMQVTIDKSHISKKVAVLSTLAITLLNPHVYLDTVVIVGSVASNLDFSQKIYFLIGALFASLMWFVGLGYGGKKLAPLFAKAYMWKILDVIVAMVMFFIAYQLFMFAYDLLKASGL